MKLQTIFQKDINRSINGVIKVVQDDETSLRQELEEYIITRELRRHFRTFLDNYAGAIDQPTDRIGVWISGFFGSGKSHFLKMLSYLLTNREVTGKKALDHFRDKFDDAAMYADAVKCASVPTESILFNIDIKGSVNKGKTAVLRVFAKVFYDHCGFYGDDLKVARLERFVDRQGKTEAFQAAFQQVNGYLPSHTRVFSDGEGQFKPELLTAALEVGLPGLDREKVADCIQENRTEALYQYLLLTQCNALHEALPVMFERVENWTELLLPDHLLKEDGVLGRLVTDIPDQDWTDQVQIIGWLYQYYNSEVKAETFALLKKNVKITRERIPSATQLFTPDWIVRYMVENSLGRLWLEGHPDKALREGWRYYLDEAQQEPEVAAQLEKLRAEYAGMKPQEIKVIDPCCGSGHILVYAFDVLIEIYRSQGVRERDAVAMILENNLYGLDIDPRATQLAWFAVMMKARQYDRRVFERKAKPQVYSPKGYPEGEEFGSLLTVERLEPEPETVSMYEDDNYNRWCFRRVLAQKYDVVVTNPPYMAVSNASAKVQEYIKNNYPDSKSDMFACFIERCRKLIGKGGYQGMITQHAWMFLSSYEKLRGKLRLTDTVNMVHLGARAFEEIGGEVVQTTSFVLRQSHIMGYKGTYCRLIEPTTQQGKEELFLSGANRYQAQQDNFAKIPGAPVAYWVGEAATNCFYNNKTIEDYAFPRQGLATGDNDTFLRLWYEVSKIDIKRNAKNHEEFFTSGCKYIPYNKGGAYRKWFANIEWIIRFDKPHYKVLETVGNHLPSKGFYFKESITWSKVTSGGFSMRYIPSGSTFDVAGCSIFADNSLRYILAFTNTIVMQYLMNALSQTLNYEVGNVKSIPLIFLLEDLKVETIASENIKLSKCDLDSFETSWDFRKHPLI